MTDNFYRAFEEKYRGPRELIKERLSAYLPFLDAILSITNKPQAIDLGCGRGEWLEYLKSLGFNAQGVDLDEGMLEACQELGLSAKKGEMIEFIGTLPDASCMVVSAFHVVEHIRFEDVKIFVQEALRVLQPGGLLIMETPNPENIVVATRNFYLDPTHQNPIPPDLLHFVSEHAGFSRSKIVRLQEPPELREKPEVTILDVFAGASPDYAVVAQKLATAEQMAKFDTAFNQDYGLSLENLLGRWDARHSGVEQKLSHVENKADEGAKAYDAGLKEGALQTQLAEKDTSLRQAEVKTARLEQELRDVLIQHAIAQTQKDAQAIQTKAELHEVHHANHHHFRLLQERDAQLHAVLNSKSWRITWPLRKFMQFTKWLLRLPLMLALWLFALPKKVVRHVLTWLIRFAAKHHGIRLRATRWLNKHPRIRSHVRLFAQRRGLLPGAPAEPKPMAENASAQEASPSGAVDLSTLTPRARQIYNDLKAAIEQNKGL